MFNNRTKTLRFIRYGLIGLAAILIALYALSRSLNYIRGPQIEIFQPINGSTISTSTVTIIGRADRVNSLDLNGRTIFIDESGNFKETLLVFPGVNTITMTAHDQFDRSVQNTLELVGTSPQ